MRFGHLVQLVAIGTVAHDPEVLVSAPGVVASRLEDYQILRDISSDSVARVVGRE